MVTQLAYSRSLHSIATQSPVKVTSLHHPKEKGRSLMHNRNKQVEAKFARVGFSELCRQGDIRESCQNGLPLLRTAVATTPGHEAPEKRDSLLYHDARHEHAHDDRCDTLC